MIGGDVVNDVPPKDRDIAMVFQNYALYPHMTWRKYVVRLRLKRYPKAEIKTRIDEAARMLDIVELVDRKPKQLSGVSASVSRWAAPSCATQGLSVRRTVIQPRRQAAVQMRIEIKKVHQKVRTTTSTSPTTRSRR